MKIKNPINLVLGIVCLMCFASNVRLGRDSFTISASLVATVYNFIFAFTGID